MYNPAPFRESRQEILFDFIEGHPLGALITCSETEGLNATHVPMMLERNVGVHGVLRCHLARANSQWQGFASLLSVLVIFGGAEHYVTPAWYPSKTEHGRVVPTWNYAAVHVWGRAKTFDDEYQLLTHLRQLTLANESSFPSPWRIDDAPPEYISGLTKAIVGVEISIEHMEGKWKLSQNRSDADQDGVIEGLGELGTERSLRMAKLMKTRRAT